MLKKITFILITSLFPIFAAATTDLIPVSTFRLSCNLNKTAAQLVSTHLKLSPDKTAEMQLRFDPAVPVSGKFGSVYIPSCPAKGDIVVKFSSDGQADINEISTFQTIARLLREKPSKGFEINLPVAIFEICGSPDFRNIQLLPYVPHTNDLLIADTIWNHITQEDTQEKNDLLVRVGEAFGVFQSTYYDETTKTTLSHRDLGPGNILFCEDDQTFTLIDIGTMRKESPSVDTLFFLFRHIYMLFYCEKGTVNIHDIQNHLPGIKKVFCLFYTGYLKTLDNRIKTLLNNFVTQHEFEEASKHSGSTFNIFGYKKDPLINLHNRAIRWRLEKS